MKIQKLRIYAMSLLILLLLLSRKTPLAAQQNEIRFEHISWDDGLSQVTVRSIIQDSRGFMWFATDDGLNKYNGYDFTVYRHNAADTGSIPSNQVMCLFEDSREVLWIGTRNGLSRFDKNTETFTRFNHGPENEKSLSSNVINALSEDAAGNLWIGTPEGLNKLNRESGHFTRYKFTGKDSADLSQNIVNALAADLDGNIWAGTEGGLIHFEVSSGNYTQYTHEPNMANSLSHSMVLSLHINSQGIIWIGTFDGLNSFNPAENKFVLHKPSEKVTGLKNHIFSISQDLTGKIWYGTIGGGLFVFDPVHNTFTHHLKENETSYTLSDNSIIEIYTDTSGYVWLGTQAGGINKLNSKGQNFSAYQQIPSNKNSLQGSTIWGVIEDSAGLLWVATDQGLNKYNKKTEKWTHYTNRETKNDALNSKSVWSIFEDKSGNLWIGGTSLSKLKKETGTFTHYQDDSTEPKSLVKNAWKVLQDKEGLLWVATVGSGLKKFNEKTGKLTHYLHDPNKANSLSNNLIWDAHIDSSGIMWLGTNGGGLNRFDKKTGKFTHYLHQAGIQGSLSNNYIYSIHEDEEGSLWVGTNGGGLNKFDKGSQTFKAYKEKDGLINNVVYGILEDGKGNLWLSTNKGLSRFNPQTETFKNYDSRDGLQSNEFSAGAYFKNEAGEMYFGGINGLNIFHPDSIKGNTAVPPIVITDFQIFNKAVPIGEDSPLQKHISETDEITLSYTQSVFSFEFVALNYVSPDKNQYAYMLEGFDKDWYSIGNRRFATYTNIPPGTYTFRVKASNNDGIWNEEGASIQISIVPPFWQTTWFYLLLFIFLVVLVAGIFQLRLRNLSRTGNLLKKQVSERTNELSQEKGRVQKQNEQLNSINGELKSTLKNLRNTQVKLVQSEKMASLGQLTAGVAHEINNPVNFISAGIDSLKANYEDIVALLHKYRGLKENENAEESFIEIEAFEQEIKLQELLGEITQLFKGIKEGAGRTKEIVKSLQNFSRLDENNLKKADLNEGLEATLSMLQPNLTDRIQVVKAYGNLPEIECFPGQINQVFMNILSNAIQAIEGEGRIQITTRTDKDFAIVEIKDSGKGIPPEIIHKIFDPFFTTKEVGKGTGLGLSISYGIIAKHNGRLSADSPAGKGAIFTIELPLVLKKEISIALEKNE